MGHRIRLALCSLRKMFCYAFFGAGGLFIGLVVLTVERILIHPASRYRRIGRLTITYSHRFFVKVMKLLGLIRITGPLPDVSGLEGKIVAPNHPSLIDVVILFSLIPGANCIVNGNLTKGPLRFIINQLYIVNSEDIDMLVEDCCTSLTAGDTLIIFPEGTRTRRDKPITLKRGTTLISIMSGASIVPFFIRGNDKKGLQKNDHFWSINDDGYYTYEITRSPDELEAGSYYTGHPRNDSIRMMEDLETILRENIQQQ